MNRSPVPNFSNLVLVAIALASSAVLASEERVLAFSDRYEFRNAVHPRLDSLESAVRDVRPATVRIDACGPGAARAAKAAAHRLSDFPLDLAVQDRTAANCQARATAMPVSLHAAPLSDIDDGEVERYWRRIMP